jgi:anti-anti-sigma regulatory factor
MSQLSVSVKANGDLVGEAVPKFKEQLLDALRSDSPNVLVDLARPSAIDGQAIAALLMAQKSAAASDKCLLIKLAHPEWLDFGRLTGLEALLTE